MYLDQAIEQYGRRIGLPNLVVPPGQHLCMPVGERRVGIEPLERQLLIAVIDAGSHRAADGWLAACRHAHADGIGPWQVQVAMSSANGLPALAAAVRLDEQELDELRIDRAIAFLIDWLSRLDRM